MITMEGEQVILEPLDIKKHAEGFFRMSQDEKIYTYLGNSVPECVDEVREMLELYERLFLNWMILSRETGEVIGILRLSKPEGEQGSLTAGESQRLASRYWRKGYMKEAKKLFYAHVFDELGVQTLYADVWEGNVNSMRSLESYGYRLVEKGEEVFSKTGELTGKYIYALTAADYRLQREGSALTGTAMGSATK